MIRCGRCHHHFLVSLLLILLLHHLCGVAQSLSSVVRCDDALTTTALQQQQQQQSTVRYASCHDTKPDEYVSRVLEWLDAERISWRLVSDEIDDKRAKNDDPVHRPGPPASRARSHASFDKIPIQFCSVHSTRVELIESSILLHLIPTPTSLETTLPPALNKRLTDWASLPSQRRYKKIIHLHQDVWIGKNDIVKARLSVQSGGAAESERIFARKTIARRLNATEARSFLTENHLWGATKAKHHYGLYRERAATPKKGRRRPRRTNRKEEELVAVATFSRVRHVTRCERPFRSHELLRYCSLKECTVVGGITKLMKAFEREVQPDDVVTMVDRDWGEADGWRTPQLGFETMSVLDPLVMAVSPTEIGIRRYLVGAGLKHEERISRKENEKPPTLRLGLPPQTRAALDSLTAADEASRRLARDGYYPVHDAGVERLYKIVSDTAANDARQRNESAKMLWRTASPRYVARYYSNNTGIVALLEHAAEGAAPLDHASNEEAMDSWRATSKAASSASVIFSTRSSMDPDATIEVRARPNGWRTLGIFGSERGVSSIYHGIYRVDERSGRIEPDVVISEQIKSMAALSLAGLRERGGTGETGVATRAERPCGSDSDLRFLHFGYGAGTLVRLLAHHVECSRHIAVELDRGVIDAAVALNCTLPENASVVVQDALDYVREHHSAGERPRFHCICIDVFDEKNLVPDHFYSTQFLLTLRDSVLTPEGIIVQNFHSGGRKRNSIIETATENMRRVFRDVCRVPSADSRENAGNLLVMASKATVAEDGDGNAELTRSALEAQAEFGFGFDMAARVQCATRMEGDAM